jgi:hypothetical protein
MPVTEQAARRLMQHSRASEPSQDGRIYIERINAPFLFGDKATAAEYKSGLDYATEHNWIELHESGTYIRFTQSDNDLFA